MIEILLDAGQITIQTDADAAAAAAARQENEKAELTDGHSTEMDISDEQVSLPSPKDLEGTYLVVYLYFGDFADVCRMGDVRGQASFQVRPTTLW